MDANHDPAGYHEIEHIADWGLEAWRPDLPSLLDEYCLSGVCLPNTSPLGSR